MAVREEREVTIPIPYVRFGREDLAAIAERFEAIGAAERERVQTEVKEYVGTELTLRDRKRLIAAETERALQGREPRFSVATEHASFSGASWDELWARVSTSQVRSIEMDWSTWVDPDLSMNIKIDLTSRRTGAYTNRVHIKSANTGRFEAESGFFRRLFDERRRPRVEGLSSGPFAFVVLSLGPAWIAGVAIQMAGLRARGAAPTMTTPIDDLVFGALFGAVLFVVLGDWWARVIGRTFPRVIIDEVGRGDLSPHFREIIVGVALAALLAVVGFTYNELTRPR